MSASGPSAKFFAPRLLCPQLSFPEGIRRENPKAPHQLKAGCGGRLLAPLLGSPEDGRDGSCVPTDPRSAAGSSQPPAHARPGARVLPRAPGQERRPPRQSPAQPARPRPLRQSWSRSQWDTAEKDKRKDSKNKIKTAQCPTPLKTQAASETRPSARMGAEAEAAGTRENLTMQLILALT